MDLADGRAVQALASLLTEAGVAAALPDDPLAADARELGSEVGELLLAIVDTAQRLGVDAEQALRSRALELREDIVAAEGVPDPQVGNR